MTDLDRLDREDIRQLDLEHYLLNKTDTKREATESKWMTET